MARSDNGSAGDADYGRIGPGYAAVRQPDPRIEAIVWNALGDARTVLNVGAGAGSYEPYDREVTAVEPSESMRAERPAFRVPAIDATSDALPFDDDAFDASMASVTIHQWPHLEAGLREMRRVTRGPVVILTFDPDVPEPWWQPEYVPELFDVEARRMPALDRVAAALGGEVDIRTRSRFPPTASTGSTKRSSRARSAPSSLACVVRRRPGASSTPEVVDRYVRELSSDLESGDWDARWGRFRTLPEFDVGLRLVVAQPVSRLDPRMGCC